MPVWRIDAWMELDPSTPGMGSFESKVDGYLQSDAITIALTNEQSYVNSIVATSGNPGDRRIWFDLRLCFTDRSPFDDVLGDLFTVTDPGPPPTYGAFLFPDRVLTVDPADPDPTRSRIIAHTCQHDALPFAPCNGSIVAQWREGTT